MKVTLNLNSDLVNSAMRLTEMKDVTAVVHAALATLIQIESGRKLAALGGTMPGIKSIPRRRSKIDE